MKTVRWLGAVLVAALGVAAAAFVGAVSPAGAGEQGIPMRLDAAEHTLTIQGEAIESLRQQVITLSGQDFGALQARMDKLDKQIGDLKSELAEARKETADLRGRLGAEVARLDARIDMVQTTINAIADGDAALAARMGALEDRVTALEGR